MKKNVLFLLILLLLVGSSILIVSCSKESVQQHEEIETCEAVSNRKLIVSVLSPQQIAEYHNIAVELYLNNYKGEKQSIGEIINTLSELMSIHHPELMNGTVIDNNDNILSSFYSKYAIDNDMLSHIVEKGLDNWVSQGLVSEYFAEGIKYLVRSKSTFEEAIAWMNEYEVREDHEQKCVSICKSLLCASNYLWNESEIDIPPALKKCSSWAIYADTFVTLLAWETGPGSVLLGGAASIAVNEFCP